MAQIETFRTIYRNAGIDDPPRLAGVTELAPPAMRKHASAPFVAGATGRRGWGWSVTRAGLNTLLTGNLDQVRARSRDTVRNNGWGTAAVDRFESNVIGTGIQPHWKHPDQQIRDQLQVAWNRWVQAADWEQQSDFYGLQAVIAREVFESGECFVRFRLRPSKDRLYVPLQLQLLESEQLPIWRQQIPSDLQSNSIRCGIEFDADDRRVAYHFYRANPGETMFYPDAYVYVKIPSSEICHVYKPLRAGQFRGQPRMAAVLALLYEIEQYTDAALVKKKISSMFAGFIEQQSPEADVLPTGNEPPPQDSSGQLPNIAYYDYPPPGTDFPEIQPGTLQSLYPGEKIVFSQTPTENDFDNFITAQLHKFAAGIGMPYYQVTGDLRRVNYSSIRAGLLEFRRSCEQFQHSIIVHQACQPILNRWLDEAVLAGRLRLPGYFSDPWPYRDVDWVPPGWDWVDPKNESEAAQADVRNGFTSREMVVRSRGLDPTVVDAQNAADRQRQDEMGLIYDSNPNKVLIGRETQPTIEEPVKTAPGGGVEEAEDESAAAAFRRPPRVNGKVNGKAPHR